MNKERRRKACELGYAVYEEGRSAALIAFDYGFDRHSARKAADTAIADGFQSAWLEMVADHATGGNPALSPEAKAMFGLAAGGFLAAVGLLQRVRQSRMLRDSEGLQSHITILSTVLAAGGLALASQTFWGSAPREISGEAGSDEVELQRKKQQQEIKTLREAAENATDEDTRQQFHQLADQMELTGDVGKSGGSYVNDAPQSMQDYLRQMDDLDI